MTNKDKLPVLICHKIPPNRPGSKTRSVGVWCPYCRKKHIHGLSDDLKAGELSHRGAHCRPFHSTPFSETGYYLYLNTAEEIAESKANQDLL